MSRWKSVLGRAQFKTGNGLKVASDLIYCYQVSALCNCTTDDDHILGLWQVEVSNLEFENSHPCNVSVQTGKAVVK